MSDEDWERWLRKYGNRALREAVEQVERETWEEAAKVAWKMMESGQFSEDDIAAALRARASCPPNKHDAETCRENEVSSTRASGKGVK